MSVWTRVRFTHIAFVLLFCSGISPAQEEQNGNAPLVPESVGEATYHLEELTGGLPGLRKRYSTDQLLILQKLNRRDLRHLARLKRMIVPDEWRDDQLSYSPFPAMYNWAARYPKALVVHHPGQAFAGYEHGRLVRWGPVSSGRKSLPTPSGLFHLNWKSRGRSSTVDPDWYMRWYFNFEARRGLSLHQFSLPGYPASHACERLLESDAVWLFGWGEEWELDSRSGKIASPGTPLLIIGRYDYSSPPPWMSPEWAANGIALPAEPVLERSDR